MPAVWRILRSRAAGAAAAQLWQAVGSFVLQVAAAWTLGAAGLGLISLCLGVIVLATALTSGMVGDGLVVLDRHDRRIRGGLQAWALILAGISGTLSGSAMALAWLTPVEAVLFAGALVAFQFEELVRRLFMANRSFWKLVIIDTVAVGGTLALVGTVHVVLSLSVAAFFAAMTAGQLVGLLTGILLLPASERVWAPLRGSDLRGVFAFGAWRGAQVAVPPLVLTGARLLVVSFAGSFALGLVEAARILVAPLLLIVQGLGSYFMSDFAHAAARPLSEVRRRASRGSVGMISSVLVLGAVLVAVAPSLGVLVTGPSFAVDRVTVAGWVLYVAGVASLQPFASLAVVRGRQRAVFACRASDAAAAVAGVSLLLWTGVTAAWVPYVLAAAQFLGGLLVRRYALTPLAVAGSPSSIPSTTTVRGNHA